MTNTPPAIAGLDTSIIFDENTVNATPRIIDGNVTVREPDHNFNLGTLTVSGHLGEDSIAIRDEGSAAGQIGFSGGSISYGGIVIGTATGGAAGATLTVTFNANVTTEAVEATIENLTYANSSDTPTESRTLTVTLTDGDGAVATIADFVAQTGAANPFDGFDAGTVSKAAFGDIDGDGDLDMVVGRAEDGFAFYLNTGTAPAPVFSPAGDIGLTTVGNEAPVLADVDNDGDLDLLAGNTAGGIEYFKNVGTATAAIFWSSRPAPATPSAP